VKTNILKRPLQLVIVLLLFTLLSLKHTDSGKADVIMKACQDLAFSVSEDFYAAASEPPDGNPIISDGDLIGMNCTVCARNADILADFDVNPDHDLGLDAVDIIDGDGFLIALSTELDSPTQGMFKAGDLLVTHGTVFTKVSIIPNRALTYSFNQGAIKVDLGLDAVHFVGEEQDILEFLEDALENDRDDWLSPEPSLLHDLLISNGIDIWFSTEGTGGPIENPLFLDGDVLSARYGIIISPNSSLLPGSVPAGIPARGVDFGLDALTNNRTTAVDLIHFSTEILYTSELSFTDGDVLKIGNGVEIPHIDLISCFNPEADMFGLDALYRGDLPLELIYLPLLSSDQPGPQ